MNRPFDPNAVPSNPEAIRLSAALSDRRADDEAQVRALREWGSPEARCRRADRFCWAMCGVAFGVAATMLFVAWVWMP